MVERRDIQARIEAANKYQSEMAQKRINRVATEQRLSLAQYMSSSGRSMTVLSQVEGSEIPHEMVEGLLTLQDQYAQGDLFRQCFVITQDAIRSHGMTGRLKGIFFTAHNNLTSIYKDHAVNFTNGPEESVLGVDFTTSETIDGNQGKMHLLVLQARSLDRLRILVEDVYGGVWQTI